MFPIANFHFLFQFWFKQYFVFINTVLILIIYQKLGGGGHGLVHGAVRHAQQHLPVPTGDLEIPHQYTQRFLAQMRRQQPRKEKQNGGSAPNWEINQFLTQSWALHKHKQPSKLAPASSSPDFTECRPELKVSSRGRTPSAAGSHRLSTCCSSVP